MKKRICLFTLTAMLLHLRLVAAVPNYRLEIGIIYQAQNSAWLRQDLVVLLRPYGEAAVVMPEYHLTLFGKQAIAGYYRQYLDSAKISQVQRKITEIRTIKNYLLESGTFRMDISRTGKKPYSYQGKYLHVWRIAGGHLWLVSEIWGSSCYVDRSQLPLSAYVSPDTAAVPQPQPSRAAVAVDQINRKFEHLIVASNGLAMADYYTTDAIYMPYYRPMLKGVDSIRAYYKEHENPKNGVKRVRIKASQVLDLDDYVVENGYYNVYWQAGTSQGTVTGKNITVWKRDKTGRLYIYRQMTCHD